MIDPAKKYTITLDTERDLLLLKDPQGKEVSTAAVTSKGARTLTNIALFESDASAVTHSYDLRLPEINDLKADKK